MVGELLRRCQQILTQERIRILRKGKMYLIALAFNIVLFWLIRVVAVKYWPSWITRNAQYQWHIFFFGTQTITWVTHLSTILIFDGIDHFKLFYEYKVNKENLIWDVDPEGWRKLRRRAIFYNFITVGLIGPVMFFVDSFFTKIRFTPEVPSVTEMLLQLYFLMTIEATFFYIFHRYGHELWYNYHKLHHEFIVPCPLATAHTHPIDYSGTLLPFAIGVILLQDRLHYITFVLWIIWRVGEGHDGHSNYNLPWSPFRIIPFSGSGQYHSFHHTHNSGNYGSTCFIQDTLTNKNSDYDEFVQQQINRAKNQ